MHPLFQRGGRLLLPVLLALAAVLRLPAAAPVAVAADQFLPDLAAQLAAHFGVAGDLELSLLRTWQAPRVPSADWKVAVVAPPATLAGQMIVRVRLTAEQRTIGEWNLPLQARLWADGLVARQPVGRGQPLALSAFDLRRTDFLRDKDAVPADSDLAGMTVSRPLGAGTVLNWRDVTRRALVQRGSRIEVVASSGALVITMKGVAMQNGALGETITVRNPESRRDFSAVVTAENCARVVY